MTHRRTSYICFTLSALLALVTLLLVFVDTARAGLLVRETAGQGPRRARSMPTLLVADSCAVTNAHTGPAGPHTKRATFTVSGDCVLSLVSYKIHGTGALADQVLYDSTTEEFSCAPASARSSQPASGASTSTVSSANSTCVRTADLTVTVPKCRFQVDLVIGQPRPTAYGYPAGSVLAWRFGGNGECQTPSTTTAAPTTTTSAPTSSSTTTSPPPASTASTTVVVGPASSVVPPADAPTTPTEELPQSGSGDVVLMALGGLGFIAAGRYVEAWGRRRRTG